jgi:hypothetical protein
MLDEDAIVETLLHASHCAEVACNAPITEAIDRGVIPRSSSCRQNRCSLPSSGRRPLPHE